MYQHIQTLAKPAKLIVLVIIISSAFGVIFRPAPISPIEVVPVPLVVPASVVQHPVVVTDPVTLPVRLKIPAIGVDATVEDIGLTKLGTMGVPAGPDNVGWFDLGPRPGVLGNAVIDGHFGFWKNGQATVFNKINKLRSGDQILIEDVKGAITTFVVREVRTYAQNADASSVFNSSDGKAHLNLITCEGIWNAAKQSFPDRLVVFADKQE